MSSPLTLDDVALRVTTLVEANRVAGLWFFRSDWVPRTAQDMLTVLNTLQRTGDLATFREAGTLKAWLLQNCSATS